MNTLNTVVKQPITILSLQRVGKGSCEHTVKTTRIGDGWNIRVFVDGVLNQETRVYKQTDIGAAARSMLRWEDKCGNISQYASSARHRGY